MRADSDKSPDVRGYLGFRLDEIKFRIADSLSAGVSSVLALMTIIAVGAIASAFVAFGMVVLLGELLGSWAMAAFIVGGLFLALLVLLIIFRKRLFRRIFDVQFRSGLDMVTAEVSSACRNAVSMKSILSMALLPVIRSIRRRMK